MFSACKTGCSCFNHARADYVCLSTLYDAVHFDSLGVYANPLLIDPGLIIVDNSKAVFANTPLRNYPVVYMLPVAVSECDLAQTVPVYSGSPALGNHKRLQAWPFDDYMEVFSAHLGTVFGKDKLLAYRPNGALQFTTRSDSTPSSLYGKCLPCHRLCC